MLAWCGGELYNNEASIQFRKVNENMRQRDKTLDIAKGISMVLVVSYHIILCSPATENWFEYICGVLSFFTFAAGYTYRPGRRTFGESVMSRITGMMIPAPVSRKLLRRISPFRHQRLSPVQSSTFFPVNGSGLRTPYTEKKNSRSPRNPPGRRTGLRRTAICLMR